MKSMDSLAISILFSALTLGSFGQTGERMKTNLSNGILDRQLTAIDPWSLTTTGAFMTALSTTHVPGGMIKVIDCEGKDVMHTWSPFSSSLREVLDWIVIEAPRYRWQVDEGVVNLMPTEGEPELLKTRIHELHVEDVTKSEALAVLLGLPEVKEAIAKLRLSSDLFAGSILSSPQPKRFSVHCQDVTLREALNAIVRAHGRGVWLYSERHCNGEVKYMFHPLGS